MAGLRVSYRGKVIDVKYGKPVNIFFQDEKLPRDEHFRPTEPFERPVSYKRAVAARVAFDHAKVQLDLYEDGSEELTHVSSPIELPEKLPEPDPAVVAELER